MDLNIASHAYAHKHTHTHIYRDTVEDTTSQTGALWRRRHKYKSMKNSSLFLVLKRALPLSPLLNTIVLSLLIFLLAFITFIYIINTCLASLCLLSCFMCVFVCTTHRCATPFRRTLVISATWLFPIINLTLLFGCLCLFVLLLQT